MRPTVRRSRNTERYIRHAIKQNTPQAGQTQHLIYSNGPQTRKYRRIAMVEDAMPTITPTASCNMNIWSA